MKSNFTHFWLFLFLLVSSFSYVKAKEPANIPVMQSTMLPEGYTQATFSGMTVEEFVLWCRVSLCYPKKLDKEHQGEVRLSFIIDETNKLRDIKVISSSHPLLSKELTKLTKKFSHFWRAGKDKNGSPVAIAYTVCLDYPLPWPEYPESGEGPENKGAQKLTPPTYAGQSMEYFRLWIHALTQHPGKNSQRPEKVVVNFMIDENGAVQNLYVMESNNSFLSGEVCRVIMASSGDWTPTYRDGEPISMRFTLPVIFD